MLPVVDVSDWQLLESEQTGDKAHPWLRDPDSLQAWLFKPVIVKNGNRQGEDWSERLAADVALLLGVPAAQIDLAQRMGVPGCISRDLKPRGWQLQPGAVLLTDAVANYRSRLRGRPGHSLSNIRRALESVDSPPGFQGRLSAFEVFAGFLVLDALIANRDRHDENWAVLRPPPAALRSDVLCGSFDHSSSLGYNVMPQQRARLLKTDGMATWVLRGSAHLGVRRSVRHADLGARDL